MNSVTGVEKIQIRREICTGFLGMGVRNLHFLVETKKRKNCLDVPNVKKCMECMDEFWG